MGSLDAPNELLASVRVDLKNTECIALGINKVSLPARAGHGKFWKGHHPTLFSDHFRRGIEILDFEGTHEGIRAALGWRRLRRSLQHATPRSSGFDAPIGTRSAFNLSDFPVERLGVETNRAGRIVRLYFEVDVSVIHLPIFAQGFERCNLAETPETVTATAAMAAVSARRIVEPRLAETHPACWKN